MIANIEKVLLTGKTRTSVVSRDGRLNIALSTPGNEHQADYTFDNVKPHPTAEQLFAGAWSACFITALGIAAKEKKVMLSSDMMLEIEADLGTAGKDYFLQVRITASMPGVDRYTAEEIMHAADEMCVYSKATRGNINVALKVL